MGYPIFRLRPFGLTGRAIALCIFLVLGSTVAVIGPLIWRTYGLAVGTLTEHALTQARSISYSAEPAVLLNDLPVLRGLSRAATSDDAVIGAEVHSSSGEVLASFRRDRMPDAEQLPTHIRNSLALEVNRSAAHVERTQNRLLVVVPIWPNPTELKLDLEDQEDGQNMAFASKELVGYVAMTYSLNEIRSQFVAHVVFAGIIAAVVIIGGTFVTILAVRQLLRPVHNLVQTATNIADGDLSERAADRAVGEIGVLARAFNHMADRLQDSYESIEKTVEQRTAELSRANRVKSEFLANMSHEIRTPMAAILGYTDLLWENIVRSGDDSCLAQHDMRADNRSHIETIQSNGQHLLQIIDDILDLTRVEASKLEMEQLPVNTLQLVSGIASTMQIRAAAKGLGLSVEYAWPIPETFHTDPTRLRQVLLNLIGNAVKFTKTGVVRLVVHFEDAPRSTSTDHQVGPLMCFDVIDPGIGMTAENIERIFDAFTQADTSMARKFGGTGLGLAISKRLANLLGGDITVSSEPDLGSTFRLTVAAGAVDGVKLLSKEEHRSLSNRALAEEHPPEEKTLQCRILLAEDAPDNQRLISFILTKAGADVTIAENGQIALEEALAAMHQRQSDDLSGAYDIILMDMQMPVMDGYEATRSLRREGYTGPIIALTAHAMASDRDECLRAGCTDYLTKPIDRHKLIDALRTHMLQPVAG